MKIKKTMIQRTYIIKQKELKAKFGIKGDIISLGLCAGLNEYQEKKGESHDTDEYEIITKEYEL